eukprot:319678_1
MNVAIRLCVVSIIWPTILIMSCNILYNKCRFFRPYLIMFRYKLCRYFIPMFLSNIIIRFCMYYNLHQPWKSLNDIDDQDLFIHPLIDPHFAKCIIYLGVGLIHYAICWILDTMLNNRKHGYLIYLFEREIKKDLKSFEKSFKDSLMNGLQELFDQNRNDELNIEYSQYLINIIYEYIKDSYQHNANQYAQAIGNHFESDITNQVEYQNKIPTYYYYWRNSFLGVHIIKDGLFEKLLLNFIPTNILFIEMGMNHIDHQTLQFSISMVYHVFNLLLWYFINFGIFQLCLNDKAIILDPITILMKESYTLIIIGGISTIGVVVGVTCLWVRFVCFIFSEVIMHEIQIRLFVK